MRFLYFATIVQFRPFYKKNGEWGTQVTTNNYWVATTSTTRFSTMGDILISAKQTCTISFCTHPPLSTASTNKLCTYLQQANSLPSLFDEECEGRATKNVMHYFVCYIFLSYSRTLTDDNLSVNQSLNPSDSSSHYCYNKNYKQ